MLAPQHYQLNTHWRVIYDPLQWILQHLRGGRWRDRSFCVTRRGLLRCIDENCGEADLSEILGFPEWHPDRVALAAIPAPRRASPPPPPTELLPTSLAAGRDIN
jgi:hypothetical protein